MPVCPCCDEAFDDDDEAVFSGDEIFDLLAEAARVSPHARRAYDLLRDANPALMALDQRQRLIAGRMEGVPL